jgi:hypothetical protein
MNAVVVKMGLFTMGIKVVLSSLSSKSTCAAGTVDSRQHGVGWLMLLRFARTPGFC